MIVRSTGKYLKVVTTWKSSWLFSDTDKSTVPESYSGL
jgi:hypothetical protein